MKGNGRLEVGDWRLVDAGDPYLLCFTSSPYYQNPPLPRPLSLPHLQIQEASRASGRAQPPHVVARIRKGTTSVAVHDFLSTMKKVGCWVLSRSGLHDSISWLLKPCRLFVLWMQILNSQMIFTDLFVIL